MRSNHTKCPASFTGGAKVPTLKCGTWPQGCGCLPLTMERWNEALDAAHRWGMQVVFNLNLLHGRFDSWNATKQSKRQYNSSDPSGPIPSWDSSEARALMEYTAKNVAPAKWPAYFGLGNELGSYVSPEQWAADNVIMSNLVQETFGKAKVAHPEAVRLKKIFSEAAAAGGTADAAGAAGDAGAGVIPSTYGPCNCMGDPTWSIEYLGNLTDMSSKTTDGKNPIAAFSFHAYDHGGSTVASVAAMDIGIDTERRLRLEPAAAVFHNATSTAHGTTTQLWITEIAASIDIPKDSVGGGAKAAVDGMCRAADIAWNLDSLGAAAEVGVDVFCRETLAGDWLEVIGLWQPGDGNQPYTPHPDFWVAALWKKLMGVRVLGATTTNATVQVATVASIPADVSEDAWVVKPGFSCLGPKEKGTGTTNVPFYGKVNSSGECQAKCAASRQTPKPCKSWRCGHYLFGRTLSTLHVFIWSSPACLTLSC